MKLCDGDCTIKKEIGNDVSLSSIFLGIKCLLLLLLLIIFFFYLTSQRESVVFMCACTTVPETYL